MENTNFSKNTRKNTNLLKKENEAKKKLNEQAQEMINILDTYFLEKYNKKLTQTNINTIVHDIETATKKDGSQYSDAWKKRAFFALKQYFNNMKKPTKLIDKHATKYFNKMTSDELKQKQSKKEQDNYLTYDELQELLNDNKNYKTENQMNRYLILATMATDQPPLRPQIYANLHIVTNKKDIKNDDKNYMYINAQKKTGYLYINDDKVHKYNEKNKIIDLHPHFLKIIIDSLKKYPRAKFINLYGKNPAQQLLYELQEKITGNKFNFDMARSSFINNWNKQNPNATDEQKIKLALSMRHTLQTNLTYYKKKEPVTGNLEKIRKQQKEQQEKKQKKNEDNEPKKYEKYKEVNKIRALITKANKTPNHKIKPDTILKYGIKQDENGKYYIPKQQKDTSIIKKTVKKDDKLEKKINDILTANFKKYYD